MFKTFEPPIWCFDAEWVPDPEVGRAMLDADCDFDDLEVVESMFQANRNFDSDNNPTPYLQTPMCRIVSVSAVIRAKDAKITLLSIPEIGKESVEDEIVGRFLSGVESQQPQIVGWNSSGADWWIFIQRALRHGMTFPELRRPDKPWNGNDYYDRNSNIHIDLKGSLSAWGRDSASLDVMAACCGIPGKIGVGGGDVLALWQAGKTDEIVAYNECDAITTYLVWLRAAYFGGFLSPLEHVAGQADVVKLLEESGKPHLQRYLGEWKGSE